MRILVTGANGQLGWEVAKRLESTHEVTRFDVKQMDLAKPATIGKALASEDPELIVHCGAYTKVDRAEDERELCHRVNAEATRAIARYAGGNDIRMIYVSTDYVFDGTKQDPYDVDDPPHPINYYGQTKLEGEAAIKELMKKFQIVRTSWLFGVKGENFVRTMMRLGEEVGEVRVVSDQFGSPTYAFDLAKLISDMVQSNSYGLYHATNEGYCSWFDFAIEIMRRRGLKASLAPIGSADYPSKAQRPRNSRLSKVSLDLAGFRRLPAWQDALGRYLLQIGEESE